LPEAQFFSRSDWDLALKKGDTVLDMHIPRADRFRMEDCQDSLRQAYQFFSRYYPERPFKACFCHTWFFSPQLQQIAPLESNIVRFQREFYLFPFAGKVAFLWFYVFGEGVKERASAPDNTTLQRSVLSWLANGGEIFDLPGVMFHGPDEWGTHPYMRSFEASA
ncbi:MAG: hypothetical protein IH586_01210, partial [Anaerolineaceae bacterium]|nr:hypothetical protein [Anaerolineaceae bacterium]